MYNISNEKDASRASGFGTYNSHIQKDTTGYLGGIYRHEDETTTQDVMAK